MAKVTTTSKQKKGSAASKREVERQRRLPIVLRMQLRHKSIPETRKAVMEELGLATYSLSTAHSDIKLAAQMIADADKYDLETNLRLELGRIDDICREMWHQWDESGNIEFIREIREQHKERRKLLGLYSPEKKEVSGDLSFTNLLMQTGVMDEEQ